MKQVILYSLLLVLGLVLSQFLREGSGHWINIATMFCLSYIMIHVGYEFEIDKENPKKYIWDYIVAGTAAGFPWLFCALYFVFVLGMNSWHEALLLARFSSPTSAGILFSMLAAAGLGATWMFKKARVLAIFDDLDTILLMIPLKILIVGFQWQLGAIVVIIGALLWAAWHYLHRVHLPTSWPWTLLYAALITLICELIYIISLRIDEVAPVQLEVLLPAFVWGCVLAHPIGHHKADAAEKELQANQIIASLFMVLVGLSIPKITLNHIGWMELALQVVIITLLSNIGKCFPLFCYRKESTLRERLALSISMFPRGEVGAGVLAVSLGYGLGGIAVVVAVLSLTLNLLLTGIFILSVKVLLRNK
jgi:Kef-type K+ transport system membrane component KefB